VSFGAADAVRLEHPEPLRFEDLAAEFGDTRKERSL